MGKFHFDVLPLLGVRIVVDIKHGVHDSRKFLSSIRILTTRCKDDMSVEKRRKKGGERKKERDDIHVDRRERKGRLGREGEGEGDAIKAKRHTREK